MLMTIAIPIIFCANHPRIHVDWHKVYFCITLDQQLILKDAHLFNRLIVFEITN
jgi:hypothetical protein